MLSQYDTPVPPLRDVNEVRQASKHYVRHEAPQRLLVTPTFPDTSHLQLHWLIVTVAIATHYQKTSILKMSNRARSLFESLATVSRYILQLCFMIVCYAGNS